MNELTGWPEPRTDPPDDDPDGIEAALEAEHEQSENIPRCAVCGNRATCRGVYEPPMDRAPAYACDTCCGHGNEDGWCEPVGHWKEAGARLYFWCETCRAFVDDTTYADGKGGLRHMRGSTIAAGYDGACGPVVLIGEDE